MMIDKPGIYPDVASADYFADPCPTPSLTQSIVKVLLKYSPGHARLEHPRLSAVSPTKFGTLVSAIQDDAEPEKYVVSQAIGNAAHALLLGRGKEIAIGNFDNWRGKDAKEFKTAALAAGKVPILPQHMARAYAMEKSCRDQLVGTECEMAFQVGASEVVVAWQEDGLWFRTLIDWLFTTVAPIGIFDYKSTALSCAPHSVPDRPSELGWDIQAAFHERGLDAIDPTNAGRRKFYYIAHENEPPYGLTPIRISEHDLTMGRKKIAYAEDIWRQCMISGEWPLYPREVVLSAPRPYREAQWIEREIVHEERRTQERMITDLAGG